MRTGPRARPLAVAWDSRASPCSPSQSRSRSRLLDETLDVFGEHVGLDVDEVARGERAKCRALGGMRDERDLEERLAERRDGERDPVEGDETLHHDVPREALWHSES